LNAGTPSPLWNAEEQRRWPVYDLAATALPDDATPRVLSITPTSDAKNEYRVITQFNVRGTPPIGPCWDTVLSVTVFAVHDSGRWLFANALPRATRDWRHETIGPITFVVDPVLQFNRSRAARSARFADSVSAMLGLGPPRPITYFVNPTTDVACEIQGITRIHPLGPQGGMASQANRQVFSGNPTIGEGYLHELAHVMVLPLMAGQSTLMAVEGIATWLGGTSGLDFADTQRDLASYLSNHPTITIDSIMNSTAPLQLKRGESAEVVAGAVLSAMVFDEGGAAALKAFLAAGSFDALRASVTHALKRPWPSIAADWRTRALSAASTSAG
jgi:hypothetical protein